MRFDLLGQLFGKNKRREMETQVAGLAKPVQVALPILASRFAAAGLAAIVTSALKGGIPHDAQGLSAVAGTALGAVMLAAPDAFQASGLVRAVSPGTVSLVQAAGNALNTFASAPKAQRNQEIQDIATQAALAAVTDWKNKTDQFTAGQLAGKEPLPAGFTLTDPPEVGTAPSAPVLVASAPIVVAKVQTDAKEQK